MNTGHFVRGASSEISVIFDHTGQMKAASLVEGSPLLRDRAQWLRANYTKLWERHSMGTLNNSASYLRSQQKRKIKSRAATVQRFGGLVAVAVSTWCVAAGGFSLFAQEQKTADVSTYPWSSIGKLNNSVWGFLHGGCH